jgi:hypothetical protein
VKLDPTVVMKTMKEKKNNKIHLPHQKNVNLITILSGSFRYQTGSTKKKKRKGWAMKINGTD